MKLTQEQVAKKEQLIESHVSRNEIRILKECKRNRVYMLSL